ncbi:MAG: glycosyltransferase family 4 protein [Gemmatimonadales bacterium]
MSGLGAPRTLMLVVTEDWYLASHRLPLIRAAVADGWRVIAATRVRDHLTVIAEAGAEVVALPMARESRNLAAEWAAFAALTRLYREYQPDIVHHVGIKPMLYGGWAARRAGIPRVVQAFAGLGHFYTDGGASSAKRALLERLLRPVTTSRCTFVLVQNDDDAAILLGHGMADPLRLRTIRGGGVDIEQFAPSPIPGGIPLVVLPARMLASKGVREFVDAARRCRANGVQARFALAGRRDEANPDALSIAELTSWVAEGAVEWLDHVADMPALLRQTSLVVLPSYREGMPKVLLEAAAVGRPIVTTAVPGCREVVTDGLNGLLVPARDAVALAAAMQSLLNDPARLQSMGSAGRRRAEAEFTDAGAAAHYVALYHEVMQCSA